MKILHVVSHTHWDREWYQTFQQFRLKLVHLIDKLLDILETDPDFKYFMLDGQTIVLDDYLQMRPENESVLREHIQNGRILIGPWHILPDMFLVSPEAHIRNLLQGKRTASKFGLKMSVGYIPDPFGHPGQVPQILKGFGIEAAVLWRGLADQPAELWWQSPDGSKILLAYLRDSYSNGANLPVQNSDLFAQQIALAGKSLSLHSAVHDHLIMLGTDHMEPSPYTSAAIAYANKNLPDTKIIHSTLPDYIKTIKDQIEKLEHSIPTVQGELRACSHSPLLPGVLSTRMWIKQRNHHSQTLLEKWAEPFSVFEEKMIKLQDGLTAPVDTASNRIRNTAPIIRQAWRILMENHPHDSICGCSIDQVHNEMKPRFDQVDQIAEELILQSLQSLSRAVDTQSKDCFTAIVLFNPHGHTHRDRVEVALNIPENVTNFELLDIERNIISHEFIGSSNNELANLLLRKKDLRDTIGTISEGRVAGASIVRVKVIQKNETVTIDSILDEKSQPDVHEWQQAEAEIAKFEADPGVTHFHVIAHTPMASKIQFISPEIPALGWCVIWVRALPESTPARATKLNPLLKPFLPLALRFSQSSLVNKMITHLMAGDETKPPFTIENEFYMVAVSQDGTLSVVDKATQAVYTGLNRFEDGGDAGDEYNYSPPRMDSFFTPKAASIKSFRHHLMPTLEIEYMFTIPKYLSSDRNSRSTEMVTIPIFSRISLSPGIPRIDIHTEVHNAAKDHRLRVYFPAPFSVTSANHDGHFEVVKRPIGLPTSNEKWVEQPRPETHQNAFTSVSNGEIGLTIANRGLPEVEVINSNNHSEIALTLLRSVGWLSRDDLPVRQGHAGPAFETPEAQMPGKWGFDYSIISHKGDWKESNKQAYAFQSELRAIETDIHSGELSTQGSFISSSPSEFVISAVKTTENGKGWLVRGYNTSSETIRLNLKPLRKFEKVMQVNLAEEPITALNSGEDGGIMICVSGHEIISVMFSQPISK